MLRNNTDSKNQVLQEIPKGIVFGFNELEKSSSTQAMIKMLNRKVAKGELVKLSKGRFYKPEKTIFGQLQAPINEVVKDFLYKNGSCIGYLTGLSIYNQFGLSSQVSSVIQIGRNSLRPALQRLQYKIHFVQQKNVITQQNIPLLQYLDCIRFIKKIPDITVSKAVSCLLSLLDDFSDEQKEAMASLVLQYPPSTRALFGAMLEYCQQYSLADSLFDTLNPITTYQFIDVDKILPNTNKWNIV
ncbi:DUF6088 family protein [Lonepinella sp. BR2271]|uniref:DUF6088 family protein n=1 Tax=Lonepinella sp. BR2271 TaxID=3434550 RepID=UPI003F6DCBF9